MERCNNCGAPLEHGARFCKNCVQYIDTVHLPVPPQLSPSPHLPMMPGSPSSFNGPTVQTVPGFNGQYVRGAVSSPTPAPTVATNAPLTPPIAGRLFAPMQPFPPRTNNHGLSGPPAQEHPYVPGSHSLPGETHPTITDEARKLYEQMRYLAEQFLELFKAIPQADRKYRLSGKPSQGLVKSEVIVYKGPSTQEKLDTLERGRIIRVFAEKPGQVSHSGHVWYRISRRFAKPRYISAGQVINVYQLLQRYFQLATQLWEAVAADRLEELAHDTAYQVEVIKLEQQLECLRELYPNARGNRKLLWRMRLYQRALKDWLGCLGEDPGTMLSDPTKCGRILYHTQGCLGLGSCNWFDYGLIKSLQWLNVLGSLCSLVLLAIYMVKLPTSGLPFPQGIWANIVVLLACLFLPVYLLWFSTRGTSLPLMMGYALTRQQVGDGAQPGPASKASSQLSGLFQSFLRTGVRILFKPRIVNPRALRYLLRVVGVFVVLELLPLLCGGILAFFLPSEVTGLNEGVGQILGIGGLSFGCILVTLQVVGIFTFTMQKQLRRELIAHPRRPPDARRSAVRPAMKLLSFHIIYSLVIAFYIVFIFAVFMNPELASDRTFFWSLPPSLLLWTAGVWIALAILLYLGFLELPYRRGLRHWKTHRLDELADLRKRVDRRLSQAPSSSTVKKEHSSVQDDYTLWQYYRAQEEDVKRTSPGPFSLVQQGGAIVLSLASSLLITVASSNLIPFAIKKITGH